MVLKYVDVEYYILANLGSFYMKIINSVVGVGLYYGFLNTLSIGPSYIFLLRAWVMEEGTEREVSATTGFILGQLMMFISVYYAPLHLALSKPHTITVLVLPYLLFHFFQNNHKDFVDYRYKSITRNSYRSNTKNSIRNLSIQCVFLNNLIFPLFNHFILPSSTLSRIVNIYMFQCNNKMLFVTSSFVGWFIGHILFLKCVGLILFWIRKTLRSNKQSRYILVEWKNYMDQICKMILFIISVYYLARVSVPIFGPKMSNQREELEFEDEQNELENDYLDENKDNYQNDKKPLWFAEPLVTPLFDYNLWNRPLRYIKNKRFDNSVRDEMSQYFFYTCQSDGKQRISFTYPPSLSTFFEMIQQNMPLCTTEQLSSEELYKSWVYTNKQKRDNLSKELINRIEALGRGSLARDVLEKRTRLCNDKTKKKYLPKMYDPLLKGPHRGLINKFDLRLSTKDYLITSIKDSLDAINIPKETLWINKLYDVFPTDYREFEQTTDTLSDLDGESTDNFKGFYSENGRFYSKNQSKYLYDENRTYSITKKSIGIKNKKEIRKRVPRWPYKLMGDMEGELDYTKERAILNPRAVRIILFNEAESRYFFRLARGEWVSEIRPIDELNFRRDIIKGSMRAQRRKMGPWSVLQPDANSPLFFDKIYNFFYLDVSRISRIFNLFFSDWIGREVEITAEERAKEQEENEEKREIERHKTKEFWDNKSNGALIRSSLLIIQSIFRKYILFPSLIIAKNIVRILLFESPEWSEDWEDWRNEIHIFCNLDAIELPNLPPNWFFEGMHIKIICPFRLKPRHRSKKRKRNNSSACFLTTSGMEVEKPFGSYRKKRKIPLLKPIWKLFAKKLRKVSKQKKIWVPKTVQFLKNRMQQLEILKNRMQQLEKLSPIPLFGLREVDESNLNRNKLISNQRSNQTISESSILIGSVDSKNDSLVEKEMKDLTDRTSTIRKKIEKIKKDKKNLFLTGGINISPNEGSWDNKRLDSPKNVWKILKRRSVRLIRKSRYFFMKFFIERIYIDIFLRMIMARIINITRMTNINVKILLKLTQQITDLTQQITDLTQQITEKYKSKYSYNDETNTNNIITNWHIFSDHSSLSQAYVFYKLSQTQTINLHHFKSVFKYNGTIPFIKDTIKNFFVKKGMFDSESRHKKLKNFGMDEWKSWLMGNDHYQYDLPQPIWARLLAQKCRNRINQSFMVQKKNSKIFDSYEKDQLKHFEKQNNYKDKFFKNYKYDLLALQYLNYDYKKASSIYKSPLQENKARGIPYNYKIFNNPELFYWTAGDLDFSNYISDMDQNISDMDQNLDRKYFDWRTVNFCLTKKSGIKKNTKTRTNYYKKMDKKDLLNPAIQKHKQINPLLNWMGMNEEEIEIQTCLRWNPEPWVFPEFAWPRWNPELWFFPEFVLLYKAYQVRPWIIPINLLFLQTIINKNISENNQIQINEKKKYVYVEKDPFMQQYIRGIKPTDKLLRLRLFPKKFDFYQLSRDRGVYEKLSKNLNTFCSLIRANNPNPMKAYISYIQRNELSLEVIIYKDISIRELHKGGLFIIEPTRLSIKWDGEFIIYQTLAISQVHKRKYQTNRRCQHKKNVDKSGRNKSTARHKKLFWNRDRDQNHYDFFVPENILSPRRRRELRILNCLNSRNANVGDRKQAFCNGTNAKNCGPFFYEDKYLDVDTKQFIKFKLFLWPNYRLEDLACMNRYWFDTNNGSRFSMIRIHMYPRLRIS